MYDLGGTIDIDGLDELAPGTNLLVDGPPMVGGTRLALALVAAGSRRGDGCIIVTTDDSARSIIDQYGTLVDDVDPDRVRVVDCRDSDAGPSSVAGIPVERTAGPGRLTAIGRGVTTCFSGLESADVDGIRVMVSSVSTLLSFVTPEKAFQFLHILTSSLEDRGSLGVFTVDSSIHDDRTVNMLKRPFDGAIELRETDEDGRAYRVRGLTESPTPWRSF